MAAKVNQSKLHRALKETFPVKCMNVLGFKSFVTEEKSHGRHEIRFLVVSGIPAELIDFTFARKDLKRQEWQLTSGLK